MLAGPHTSQRLYGEAVPCLFQLLVATTIVWLVVTSHHLSLCLWGHVVLSSSFSVNGHLDCLHVLTIVNCSALNTGVYVCFWITVCSRQMCRNEIFGSHCSVAQLCPTLCDPMQCSMPSFPVLHHLLELAHTHAHWVSDAIQPSHPLSFPSPYAFNLSQHQGLF